MARRVGKVWALAVATALAGVCATVATSASAAEHVHCEVRYASQTVQVDARPTDEPLRVPSVNIDKRFAFKAVARGTAGHITQPSRNPRRHLLSHPTPPAPRCAWCSWAT